MKCMRIPSFKSERSMLTQCGAVQVPGWARSDFVAHNSKVGVGAVHSRLWRKSGKPDCVRPPCLYYLPPRKARHLSNTSLCLLAASQQTRGLIHICGLNET